MTPPCGGAGHILRPYGRRPLVADENVLDILLLENLVVDREHGTAGIAEDVFDAIVFQAWRTISRPVIWFSVPLIGLLPSLVQVWVNNVFEGIKKGPVRSLVQRMGGYPAGWFTPSCPCAVPPQE